MLSANAVRTLNEGMGPPIVCLVAQGFSYRSMNSCAVVFNPSQAMRALSETNMLVKQTPNGPPTHSHEFNGHPAIGIVLDPHYVSGLDPAAFAVLPEENS